MKKLLFLAILASPLAGRAQTFPSQPVEILRPRYDTIKVYKLFYSPTEFIYCPSIDKPYDGNSAFVAVALWQQHRLDSLQQRMDSLEKYLMCPPQGPRPWWPSGCPIREPKNSSHHG